MSSKDLDIGEQAISKAAEAGLESQMDQAEDLDVALHTEATDLAQGKLKAVEVEGEGLVVQNELRTDELKLKTGEVKINPMQAVMGEIELERPTEAEAYAVLKAEDINRAFDSDYVREKLRGQKVTLPSEETVSTDAQKVSFTIPEAGRIAVDADVMIIEQVETKHIAFTAVPELVSGGHQVTLTDMQYDDAANDMPELTQALIDTTEELLDLRNLELDKMSLKFDRLEVQPDQLVIQAQAEIRAFS
ncbi:DUF2993 domain-containing protein [Romeria aff. gracilis LEGE 07310]|uniref:DUF2993 domain-containing protein n=1 Tax=Vasconcelosia minhoensis LEGE 07310 TaxID=915328 RepID=A0A8J7AJL5_9CYAN|nr:DUF2993 domain-containing protein [Romeria gracilis]MBE9076575.1 DUF2993 domain-containing protein [Romeria aff. gracilis LEGE 07310]